MEIDTGALLAIGGVVFGAGGAFSLVKNINSKLALYEAKKDDQARRIGKAEARCSVIEGILIGRGLLAPNTEMVKRSRTAAHGFPVAIPDENEMEKERED